MKQHDLLIRLWGVRGSYPVPGEKTVEFGGNTSCVEIRNRKHRLILDSGTGIIPLGEKILREYQADRENGAEETLHLTVLLTHTHHDHIQGLPFFAPAYQAYCSLYLFGPQLLGEDLLSSISLSMEPTFCPVRFEEMNSKKIIQNMTDTDKLILRNSGNHPTLYNIREKVDDIAPEDLTITAFRSYAHPKDGVFVYRIAVNGKSIVYATDTEGYVGGDSRLIAFARGADVLIHDAQYLEHEYTDPANPKQGYGHSTIEMACEVAKKAQVGKLILFHHDPSHDDDQMKKIEKIAQGYFKNSVAGKEGMEIWL
ncbi:MAG TPA: MBL fold metallo-hydrolase [Bacteroidetes bacterium]|nr:MBL fold metallo-hydrolase [Bacteroidota bacterium]